MGVPLFSFAQTFNGVVSAPAVEGEDESAYYYCEQDVEAQTFVSHQKSPPLVNFTSGLNVYKWFRFEFDLDYDLDLFECGQEVNGRLPLWVLDTEESWERMFLAVEIEEVKNKAHPNIDWALQNGLAPGQPFPNEVVTAYDRGLVFLGTDIGTHHIHVAAWG